MRHRKYLVLPHNSLLLTAVTKLGYEVTLDARRSSRVVRVPVPVSTSGRAGYALRSRPVRPRLIFRSLWQAISGLLLLVAAHLTINYYIVTVVYVLHGDILVVFVTLERATSL